MKKYAIIPLLFLFLACDDGGLSPRPIIENEEIEDTDGGGGPAMAADTDLYGYVSKNFNLNNGFMTDSTFYVIQDNRLDFASKVQRNTKELFETEYTYIGDQLDEIATFYNGEARTKRTFTYDRRNGMTEMFLEIIRGNNANQQYRYSYTHTVDTIYMQLDYGFDTREETTAIEKVKMILDDEDKLVFFESFNCRSERTNRVYFEYDENDNPVRERYMLMDGDTEVPYRTDFISVEQAINPLYQIVENTYGKKTLMMLYCAQAVELSQINARTIAPNIISAFQTDAQGGIFSFEIDNRVDENDKVVWSSYKTYEQGELARHFEIEFVD